MRHFLEGIADARCFRGTPGFWLWHPPGPAFVADDAALAEVRLSCEPWAGGQVIRVRLRGMLLLEYPIADADAKPAIVWRASDTG